MTVTVAKKLPPPSVRRSFEAALEIEPNYPPARRALAQLIARSN
jgi:hypothetical protein